MDQAVKSVGSPSFSNLAPAVVSSKIPAAPFLVPAVIEKLSNAPKYQRLTGVVPGEADLYCAQHVKEHGGIVLTGDSDLLVHDLGALGSVGFFRDIEIVETTEGKILRCLQYHIATIMERVDLRSSQGLKALAFEMVMDPHASFAQVLQKAKKQQAILDYPGMYRDFSEEYKSLLPLMGKPTIDKETSSTPLGEVLKWLDPRISEYVLQFPTIATAAGIAERPLRYKDTQVPLDVFLPFLVDCPSKTSAWEMSTSVRQLAYGLMNLTALDDQQISTVIEHRRQQNGSRGREWQLPTILEIPSACETLTNLLKLISEVKHIPIRKIALYQDAAYATSAGKQCLSNDFISAPGPRRLTWDSVHLSAQFHGSYYSFRILRQILGVVSAYLGSSNLPSTVQELSSALEMLPALEELPNISSDLQWLKSSESKVALTAVRTLLELDQLTESPQERVPKASKKDKKKRKRERAVCSSEGLPKRPNNMFELLNTD
jgi:hypothetical protein